MIDTPESLVRGDHESPIIIALKLNAIIASLQSIKSAITSLGNTIEKLEDRVDSLEVD